VVLIKSILSAIPIYQYSAMLAPVGIMNQINLNIRKILWQGGKYNTKKYHLINWKTVRVPKDRGGLGIKDPALMNLAMGAKLLLRMIKHRIEWWKKILWKKYFRGARNRYRENLMESQKGSHIWKLLKSVNPLARSKLTWIPGNGKEISNWNERIIGKETLVAKNNLAPLKVWLDGANLKTLHNISVWDKNSSKWMTWNFGEPLKPLQP
jgi:hypothetical protein